MFLVEFTAYEQESSLRRAITAATRAFNMNNEDTMARAFQAGSRIRCTAEQFGLFIVYRLEEGITNNQVKLLRPTVVRMESEPILDVSTQGSA